MDSQYISGTIPNALIELTNWIPTKISWDWFHYSHFQAEEIDAQKVTSEEWDEKDLVGFSWEHDDNNLFLFNSSVCPKITPWKSNVE